MVFVMSVQTGIEYEQGVDVQNEPWSGIWPIPAGEAWLCDVATYLKEDLGLGESGIAVITGGISGAQTVNGVQNFPESAWTCSGIDVIGIHGYFAQGEGETAGTPWAKLFLPGDTLTSRALDSKLLLVEEWSYLNTDQGLNYKKQALFDQGNALNHRGIPWVSWWKSFITVFSLMVSRYTRTSRSKTKELHQRSASLENHSLPSARWRTCSNVRQAHVPTSTGQSTSLLHPAASPT